MSRSRHAKAAIGAIIVLAVAGAALVTVFALRQPAPTPFAPPDHGPTDPPEIEPEPATQADAAQVEPASGEPEAPIEQARTLGIGDPAPLLEVDWVRGEPAQPGDGGRAHVIEFWATWCAPCIAAMPHLSELQSRHPDGLRVVGVSIDREPTEVVRRFLTDNSERVTYDIAHDTRSSAGSSWMDAAEIRGIPASFVVGRDGRIAWIGHPMSPEFDEVVEDVVAGAFDLESRLRERESAQQRAEDAARLEDEMNELWSAGKTDEATALIDRVVELAPDTYAHLAIRKAEILGYESYEPDACVAFAAETARTHYAADAQTLFSLASIATNVAAEDDRRRTLAREIVDLALEARGDSDPAALIDHARFLATLGDKEGALDALTEARIFSDDPQLHEWIDRVEVEIDGL